MSRGRLECVEPLLPAVTKVRPPIDSKFQRCGCVVGRAAEAAGEEHRLTRLDRKERLFDHPRHHALKTLAAAADQHARVAQFGEGAGAVR